MTTGPTQKPILPIYAYFGALTFIGTLGSAEGYLVDISVSYMLKNHLHASASQVSTFRLLTGLPIYIGFIFGFVRDNWNPIRRRDRGYFIVFGALSALVFAGMGLTNLVYGTLFAGMILVIVAAQFRTAAYLGLLALVGQERLMSGRLAALWQFVASAPILLGAVASGYLTEYVPRSGIFFILAGLSALLCLLGWWRPAAVFHGVYDAPQARGSDILSDVRRLLRSRAVWPPVLLMLLFSFAPGSQTPLQYYLSDHLHASDAIYGDFTAIFVASFMPMFALYGWLCRRVSLGKLLFWGTLISIPQMIPLAFIHTPAEALFLAAPIGAMGGIITGAIYDLSMRSCPPGLHGTLMMMVTAGYALATRSSDLLGSAIYASSPRYGFVYCVIAITIVYALMLPVLLMVPRRFMQAQDGRPEVDAGVEVLDPAAEPAPAA